MTAFGDREAIAGHVVGWHFLVIDCVEAEIVSVGTSVDPERVFVGEEGDVFDEMGLVELFFGNAFERS